MCPTPPFAATRNTRYSATPHHSYSGHLRKRNVCARNTRRRDSRVGREHNLLNTWLMVATYHACTISKRPHHSPCCTAGSCTCMRQANAGNTSNNRCAARSSCPSCFPPLSCLTTCRKTVHLEPTLLRKERGHWSVDAVNGGAAPLTACGPGGSAAVLRTCAA